MPVGSTDVAFVLEYGANFVRTMVVFGQVQNENGVPPLVLCNARPFARLQCFLFWVENAFFPTMGNVYSFKKAFSTVPETVENMETSVHSSVHSCVY